MIAFIIWSLCGLSFIGLGIYTFNADKAINFWANIKTTIDVFDVKSYNKALARLCWISGTVFIILGLPLLAGQNSPLIIFSILGSIFGCIFFIIWLGKIEIKYRKNKV